MTTKTTKDKFTLEEIKERFDLTDSQLLPDEPTLEEMEYFTVGYNPKFQTIDVSGWVGIRVYTILYFEDDLNYYHIKHEL